MLLNEEDSKHVYLARLISIVFLVSTKNYAVKSTRG